MPNSVVRTKIRNCVYVRILLVKCVYIHCISNMLKDYTRKKNTCCFYRRCANWFAVEAIIISVCIQLKPIEDPHYCVLNHYSFHAYRAFFMFGNWSRQTKWMDTEKKKAWIFIDLNSMTSCNSLQMINVQLGCLMSMKWASVGKKSAIDVILRTIVIPNILAILCWKFQKRTKWSKKITAMSKLQIHWRNSISR